MTERKRQDIVMDQPFIDFKSVQLNSSLSVTGNEDLFQCGVCKKQFTSLSLFLAHKNESCNLVFSSCESGFGQFQNRSILPLLSSYVQSGGGGKVRCEYDAVNISNLSHLTPNFTAYNSEGQENSCIETSTVHNLQQPLHTSTVSSSSSTLSNFTSLVLTSIFTFSTTPMFAIATTRPYAYSFTPTTAVFQPIMSNTYFTPSSHRIHDPTLDYRPTYQTDKFPVVPSLLKSSLTNADRKYSQPSQSEASIDDDLGDLSQKRKLTCQYCHKVYTKKFDLQQHIRSHTGERPYQCIVCGRAFAQKSNVKKHMSTHKVWPSGMGGLLPTQNGANDASSAIESFQSFGDSDSTLQSTQELSIGTRIDQSGMKHTVVDNSYLCQYCPLKFKTYYLLKSHMVTHKENQVYKCTLKSCGKTFRELNMYLCHMKSHEEVMTYRCHICNALFSNLGDLGTHQISHNLCTSTNSIKSVGYRQYVCTKCQNKYASPEALEHHMTTNSHRYPCSFCNKVFVCERFLRRHLPIHGSACSFSCEICQKKFKTDQYLKMHMICHSTEKPFTCDLCSASFNRRHKLKRHLLIHNPDKIFKCPFKSITGCLKEFNRPDKLKDHILIHSGLKPYSCKHCNRQFTRMSYLTDHERTYHASSDSQCVSSCTDDNDMDDRVGGSSTNMDHDTSRSIEHTQIKPRTKRGVCRTQKRGVYRTQKRESANETKSHKKQTLDKDTEDVITIEVNIEKVPETSQQIAISDGWPVIVASGSNVTLINATAQLNKDGGYESVSKSNVIHGSIPESQPFVACVPVESTPSTSYSALGSYLYPLNISSHTSNALGDYYINVSSAKAYIVNLGDLSTSVANSVDADYHLHFDPIQRNPSSDIATETELPQVLATPLPQVLAFDDSYSQPALYQAALVVNSQGLVSSVKENRTDGLSTSQYRGLDIAHNQPDIFTHPDNQHSLPSLVTVSL